jgi:GMP synthase (glutamine-hydrolysing)
MQADKIIIIDFGSQYTKLIARKVRECGVYSEIVSCLSDLSNLKDDKSLKGIVLSGGPSSVYLKNAPLISKQVFAPGIPVLGICYGHQLISHAFKGLVSKGKTREYGRTEISLSHRSPLFHGIKKDLTVWMSHGDYIEKLPPGFSVTSRSTNQLISSFENRPQNIYGVQFHPEVHHTQQGKHILRNFLFKICKIKNKWEIGSYIDEKVREIRKRIGNERAILALSGGVDSSVAAAIVNKAIGDRLICVHIDNGLMRKNESSEVVKFFSKRFNLRFVDASKLFLNRLKGVIEPEQKRKIIGKTFIEVFQRVETGLRPVSTGKTGQPGKIRFLVQGTLYPDVIESSSFVGPSVTIKTHHNVGGLPSSLRMKLIEPLRELFKDEVREIGRILKVPEVILKRHPFPGPGLAVRILGSVDRDKLELLREADYIYTNTLRERNLYDKIWQAFAVLLPVSTVGVMGDRRTYERVVALRAVESVDGMTANWFPMPPDVLEEISTKITNKVKGVNRVVYDVSNKPPSTIEWE